MNPNRRGDAYHKMVKPAAYLIAGVAVATTVAATVAMSAAQPFARRVSDGLRAHSFQPRSPGDFPTVKSGDVGRLRARGSIPQMGIVLNPPPPHSHTPISGRRRREAGAAAASSITSTLALVTDDQYVSEPDGTPVIEDRLAWVVTSHGLCGETEAPWGQTPTGECVLVDETTIVDADTGDILESVTHGGVEDT